MSVFIAILWLSSSLTSQVLFRRAVTAPFAVCCLADVHECTSGLKYQQQHQHHAAHRCPPRVAKWNSFLTAWETAVAVSGIDDLRFHDLRHTFASWLVQRGRTLKEVQEALGHQTITMTMWYSHLAPDHLCAAVAAFDGVLSPELRGSAQGTTKAQEAAEQVKLRATQSVAHASR